MKYIFVAGAPGSKWSSVVKNIYYSPSIDRSDYRDDWTYYHDASGTRELMHLGAYFDPGMECNLPEDLTQCTRAELEAIFNQPFSDSDSGTRVIKSHIFANHINFLKSVFPETPLVMVHRSDDACLGWWVKCGHFDITYPKYDYYQDLKAMAQHIQRQNAGIDRAWWDRVGLDATSNRALARILNIEQPPAEYEQNYVKADIRVRVI